MRTPRDNRIFVYPVVRIFASYLLTADPSQRIFCLMQRQAQAAAGLSAGTTSHAWRKGGAVKLKKALLIIAGVACLVLAGIGVLLPLLPTTPFLLLAAAAFLRSSDRLYRWMHENRVFGEYLRRYRDGLGIPLASKIVSISLIWITLITSVVFVMPHRLLWVGAVLFAIGTGVTVKLLRIPTYRNQPPSPSRPSGRPPA